MRVHVPTSWNAERTYIVDVLLREFLGIGYELVVEDRPDTLIGDGTTSRELIVADGLFGHSRGAWLTPATFPREPLSTWHPAELGLGAGPGGADVPVLFGRDPQHDDFVTITDERIELGLDIFGAAFFMLTRYEEVVRHERDEHDRFPGAASLAGREGFLERPLVNEYLEILWLCMQRLWPRLERRARSYRLVLSHDVDRLMDVVDRPWSKVVRNVGGDVLVRREPRLGLRRLRLRWSAASGPLDVDPYGTFGFIMDVSEKHGLQSAFYPIAEHFAPGRDGDYSIDHPRVRALMRRIHERSHELGLHTSYHTYQDAAQTRREFTRLLQVAEEEGIRQDAWGGRQHYLRFRAPITWRNWEEAGLFYDSTLGYADRVGFRCGTCYEFPVFDVLRRRRLELRERPLIVMDVTLLGARYMNLSSQAAIERVEALAERCRSYGGQLTLLWHNTELLTTFRRRLYLDLIREIV